MKKNVLFLYLIILFSCEKTEVAINSILLKEITDYIDISEAEDKLKKTYTETGIYIVKFQEYEDRRYISLFESDIYYKKNLDGYIIIRDNKVFFYNSNKDFVNIDHLYKNGLSRIPNEDSEQALNIFDSKIIYFEIIDKNELKQINDDNFILE